MDDETALRTYYKFVDSVVLLLHNVCDRLVHNIIIVFVIASILGALGRL